MTREKLEKDSSDSVSHLGRTNEDSSEMNQTMSSEQLKDLIQMDDDAKALKMLEEQHTSGDSTQFDDPYGSQLSMTM